MIEISRQLKEVINSARPRLLSIAEARATEKPYADKWSIKEVLGHLIDSAANNHQRIVRMQESENIGPFSYAQQHWVLAQRYQVESWPDIVNLWYYYNAHLAHTIGNVDPNALNHLCDMGYATPATLKFVIEDYVRHVEHHLKQILVASDPLQREQWVPRDPRADH